MNFLTWSLAIGIPPLLLGIAMLAMPAKAAGWLTSFGDSKRFAWVLVPIGWFWTAHELDVIGIDVFDKFLKIFPGELWILALVLIPLTIAWMPKHLAMRGLSAVLMLYPATFFQCARLVDSDWRLVAVSWTYWCIVLGMYSMFYPWRTQKGIEWIVAVPWRMRTVGAVHVAAGIAVVVAAFLV